MPKDEVIEDFIAFVNDLNDKEGNQLFHPKVTETIIRAIVNNKNFIITLNQLADWLACRVDNLKRYLPNYEDGIDYKIESISPNGAGRPKEVIYLSMICVKKLALRSKGKRADQIREYFIRIEEMFRENMEHSIEKRLKYEDPEVTKTKLKRDTRHPELKAKPGPGIYAIRKESRITPSSPKVKDKFKVGMVSGNVNNRYSQLRRKAVGDTELVRFENTDDEKYMEACIHTYLEPYAQGHEIFDTDLETIDKGFEVCEDSRKRLKEMSKKAAMSKKWNNKS
jgi:phage anti-repressor protein